MYSHHIILPIFCCNEFHNWNISDLFCILLSTGCMDDIVTVLAEEHGCLDTVKVCLLVLMDSLLSLYFAFHTKINPNLIVFSLILLLQKSTLSCHSKMWFILVVSS